MGNVEGALSFGDLNHSQLLSPSGAISVANEPLPVVAFPNEEEIVANASFQLIDFSLIPT